MAGEIPRSTLTLIERPLSFLLQHRPNLPGKLAYPDKLHFFEGGVSPDDPSPYSALRRELLLPADLQAGKWRLPEKAPELLWAGRYLGEDRQSAAALRHITLYRLEMPQEVVVAPREAERGGIRYVGKTPEEITLLEPDLAPFAFEALISYVKDGRVLIS